MSRESSSPVMTLQIHDVALDRQVRILDKTEMTVKQKNRGLILNKIRYASRIYIEKTARLFYPPVCPLCRELLKENEGMVHIACLAALEEVKEPKCKRCGKPILSETAQFCRDCYIKLEKNKHDNEEQGMFMDQEISSGYDQNAALWIYEGSIRQAILDYKYHGMKVYTDFFATRLVGSYSWWIRSKKPQLLLPVPIHAKKKRIRGYNQAGLLARAVSAMTGIPFCQDLLVRNKYTEPQKTLTPEERRKNLEKVMQVHLERLEAVPERVMIIDDIYTTGATLDACATVLKKAGVKEVYGLTLCIGDTGRGR